jgi:arylsulfatase A-like enzyme
MAEIEIPWIIRGRGVVAGKELATPVNTYDTAATAAAILGLEPPKCWIARPVVEAFTTAK